MPDDEKLLPGIARMIGGDDLDADLSDGSFSKSLWGAQLPAEIPAPVPPPATLEKKAPATRTAFEDESLRQLARKCVRDPYGKVTASDVLALAEVLAKRVQQHDPTRAEIIRRVAKRQAEELEEGNE